MYALGIDAGSVATKAVLFCDGLVDKILIPTGWSPKQACQQLVDRVQSTHQLKKDQLYVVATGYGRVSAPMANKKVTEITCHARGAVQLYPLARTIIDIGGQDSKVISIDSTGQVTDFTMNDKCAAGTGRFLEVMMNLLGTDIRELDELTKGATPVSINSMCTVFAESEVIGLLAEGAPRADVALGIVQAIASRVGALAKRMRLEEQVFFTGGLAQSVAITQALSTCLEREVFTCQDAQYAGALGAALIGWQRIKKKQNLN